MQIFRAIIRSRKSLLTFTRSTASQADGSLGLLSSPRFHKLKLFSLLFLFTLPTTAHAGSAIFFHPDGMGVNTWTAVRAVKTGPDGELAWDKLEHVAVYKGHLSDGLTPSSNGGATIHAYGEKAPRDAYGLLNISKQSIAHEALKAHKGLGLINSGTLTEPGTGAFVARVKSRQKHDEIARQVVLSGAHVIMGGGEQWLLPKGVKGHHGIGVRKDNVNLIERAASLGYTVVYSARELAAVDPKTTPKLLGVFAANHTFNDLPPAQLKQANLPLFNNGAPTIAEMTEKTLAILQHHHADNFLLIAEEEATDNFGNVANIDGQLEAGKRADDAIAVLNTFVDANPASSLFVTSDSDAGGLQLVDCGRSISDFFKLPSCEDGASYISKPDDAGISYRFNALTTGSSDVAGGVVIRASGKYGPLAHGTMDNTAIYTMLKQALLNE